MDEVSHQGFVEKVEGDRASVRIVSVSACSACKSKGACSISDMKEKIVDVQLKENQHVEKGETVDVVISTGQGNRAVIIAYGIPFIIFMCVLLLVTSWTKNELWAGLSALLSIGVYFLVLHIFRHKFEKKFLFHLK
ncbi:MAG: SoxR reducing system RseC family protein [Bacteroidetes bacterium]|nr:SoxR reducing system RseC family protein [Bacteroidota bacterium]